MLAMLRVKDGEKLRAVLLLLPASFPVSSSNFPVALKKSKACLFRDWRYLKTYSRFKAGSKDNNRALHRGLPFLCSTKNPGKRFASRGFNI